MDRLSEGPAAEDAHPLGAKRPSLHAGGPGSPEAGCADRRVHYFDGGHFVLDEYADAIAEAIIETFSR